MKIGVIGTGRIGNTLGEAWTTAGHDVMYGSRHPEETEEGKTVSNVQAAAQHGEIVVFAIPGAALVDTIKALSLGNKIIIDCTNGGGTPGELAKMVPDAAVYKVFNTLGFENFKEPHFGNDQADMLYIGPEAHRPTVEALITDVRLNPVYMGGLDEIATLDAAMRFWFALSKRFGRHTAFKVLTDTST